MSDAHPSIRELLLVKYHRPPSSRSLARAVDLARRCGARLTFADVLEGGDQIDEFFQRVRLRELRALLSPHLDGVEADYRLMSGDLVTVSEEAADRFDLMFVAESERVSEAGRRDVAGLLRASPLPVWLDGDANRPPRRILAAVDVLTRDPATRGLDLEVVRQALALASVYGAELDLLSVWTPSPAPLRLVERLAGAADAVPKPQDIRSRLGATLEEGRRSGVPLAHEPRLLTLAGDATESIAQLVEAEGIDLLVAGCVGRSGLAAWLVGDTAERLSRRLGSSILAVKPSRKAHEEMASGTENSAA